MKSLTLSLAAFLISTCIIAQSGLDYMGIPTDVKTHEGNGYVPLKNTQALTIPVVKQFASPSSLPTSIAYHNQILWVIGYNEYKVYKVSSVTGNVLGSFPINIQKPYGITFKDDICYILDNISKKIFSYTETGTLLDTFDLAGIASHTYPTGLCFAGDEFWYNDTKGPNPSATNDSIFAFSELLNVNHAFEAVGAFPTGITYDGSYIWVNDNPTQTTNRVDPITHSIIKSYQTPGGAYPNGVAFDGEGLWIVNNSSDSIYYMIPEGITSIDSQEKTSEGITIYSSGNKIYLNYQNNWIGSEIAVFDCTGRLMNKQIAPSGNNFTLEASDNGIYFVAVYNKENKFSEKLIISR